MAGDVESGAAGWLFCAVAQAQDWVKTGTSLGVDKVHLAVADFKAGTADPSNTALLKTFNDKVMTKIEAVSEAVKDLKSTGAIKTKALELLNQIDILKTSGGAKVDMKCRDDADKVVDCTGSELVSKSRSKSRR